MTEPHPKASCRDAGEFRAALFGRVRQAGAAATGGPREQAVGRKPGAGGELGKVSSGRFGCRGQEDSIPYGQRHRHSHDPWGTLHRVSDRLLRRSDRSRFQGTPRGVTPDSQRVTQRSTNDAH
jgi:hypothetical protein